MLPKTHIILGAILSAILWIVIPELAWHSIIVIFLSSFLIDFDHYMCAVQRSGSLSLMKALSYYDRLTKIEAEEFKRGIR